MDFPAARTSYPTKDEMADFLEAYRATFELPVRDGVRVGPVSRRGRATWSRAPTGRRTPATTSSSRRGPSAGRRTSRRSPASWTRDPPAPLERLQAAVAAAARAAFWWWARRTPAATSPTRLARRATRSFSAGRSMARCRSGSTSRPAKSVSRAVLPRHARPDPADADRAQDAARRSGRTVGR